MKIVDIGTAYQLEDDWYIRVMLGPFKSEEEADAFALLVGMLEGKGSMPNPDSNLGQLLEISTHIQKLIDDAPPPLGINVSETIETKDKFG